MSSNYVATYCPHCKVRKLGPYNVETNNKHVVRGCPHCGKRWVVEYGQGKVRASKD